jgi:hypothetical protein
MKFEELVNSIRPYLMSKELEDKLKAKEILDNCSNDIDKFSENEKDKIGNIYSEIFLDVDDILESRIFS